MKKTAEQKLAEVYREMGWPWLDRQVQFLKILNQAPKLKKAKPMEAIIQLKE